MSARSTIREVRAVVFSTTVEAADSETAWEKCKDAHFRAMRRATLSCNPGGVVEHIGPVIATGPEAHPFAQVLIAIACGAAIQRKVDGAWGDMESDLSALVTISEHMLAVQYGSQQPAPELRVKP